MNTKVNTGNIAKIRSAGFFTKGMVYLILGGLTFMAALGLGGDIASTEGVINFLLQLPLGKALVGVVALGLTAYVLWRLYQMLIRPHRSNSGDKGDIETGFKRFRYFYSAIFYAFIAYSFAEPLLSAVFGDPESPSEEEPDKKAALWEMLSHSWGEILIWGVAFVVGAQAIWQFSLAYSAKFMKKIDNYPSIKNEYDFIRKAGRMGYVARGVVFGIISLFLVKVMLQHNADAYKGTEAAMQYLLSFSYGSFLLGAVSLGLIGYGIFNIMVARHANLTRLH
ncbi:DUF1206 domain-containing protein [Salegentibacter chungangensis]|uniref:DUF1206 domain-containing protein n=1 Tax=Salegentibacter chungangensis TaxID=1335724 RepID=A0ABW3NLV4_9FLAO